MGPNRVSYGNNNPNITQAAAASGLRDKIKRARPVDDESKRRLAWIFSGEDDEKSKDEEN